MKCLVRFMLSGAVGGVSDRFLRVLLPAECGEKPL